MNSTKLSFYTYVLFTAQNVKHTKQKKDKKEIGNDNFSTSLNTYVSYVQR